MATLREKASKSFKIGRKSDTGELTTVNYARKHPKTTTVEHMPKPGQGSAPPRKKKR